MRWPLGRLLALAALVAGTAACTISIPADDSVTPTTRRSGDSTTTTGELGTNPWDAVVADALNDVDLYWSQTYASLYGTDWQPVGGGYYPYTSTSAQPPCGEPPPTYSDIAENAFYCPSADLVAWDDEVLVPDLYDQFGGFTLGIVFAHEFGHAVQARSGTAGPTILLEQQADCFAGGWTGWVNEGSAPNFQVTLADLDAAIAGFLQLRDAPGTVDTDPQAHGSAFDRVGAFQDGYLNGPTQCVTYADGNFTVFELPFNDQQDYESGGNAPFEEVEQLTIDDLEDYWSIVLPGQFGVDWTPITSFERYDPAVSVPPCGDTDLPAEAYEGVAFYCVPADYIGWDEANLMPKLYNDIGDFAMAVIIGNQYSLAAQVRLGNQSNELDSNLQADCFTGTWVASSVLQDRENAQFVLSPGDLDEAVTAFLAFGDSPEEADAATGANGTAFQRVQSFRDGFINGVSKCKTYLP